MFRFLARVGVLTLFVFAPLGKALGAEFSLAHVFQDKMVLQSGTAVPVWGWADADSEVTVRFAGQTQTARANKDGYWRVNLGPLKISTTGETLTATCGGKTLKRDNVLVGEVWLCAGQSNMALTLSELLPLYPRLKARLGETDLPRVRFVRYPMYVSAKPSRDLHPASQTAVTWQIAGAATIGDSMTMPFFFARALGRELKTPIGLIQVAVGATPQTAWCPREVIDQVAAETDSRSSYDCLFQRAAERQAKSKRFKTWEDYEKFDAEWQRHPRGRYSDGGTRVFPCVLFNARIYPLAPFAFRGVIWHQGEGGPFYGHAERLKAMVDYWRKLFERDFVFLWGGLSRDTKLSPPLSPAVELSDHAQRNLQFQQAQVLFGDNGKAAFCDFFDLGNFNTHFGEKDKAGERFAAAALTLAYGKPRVFSGPRLIASETKPGEARLRFANAGSGLVYKPSFDGATGFVLESGKDWRWVEPKVEAPDTLVFKHEKIDRNSRIYYGYHANPRETLFNKEGFPASIFPKEVMAAKTPRDPGAAALVKFVGAPPQNAWLNMTSARRDAYAFSVDNFDRENQSVCRVRVYVPKEWGAAAVFHSGETVPLSEPAVDARGRRTAELDVATNAGAYVIYNQLKGAATLDEVDSSRF